MPCFRPALHIQRADGGSHFPDARVAEDRDDRQGDLEALLDLCNQLDAEQRVAAEIEEIVRATDALEIEQFLPYADEPGLPMVARGLIGDFAVSIGTGRRLLHVVEKPAYVAKNRYGLPDTLPLDWNALVAGIQGTTQPEAA